MAKTIKFNLICDDKPIRTIEDLQDNFSIEDILKYYENGLLLRWLNVRGYKDEEKQVSEIESKDMLEIAKKLIRIFEIETDEQKIAEGVYMLQNMEERKALFEVYKQDDLKMQSVIDDYESGYRELVVGILENPHDAAKIKANIAEMVTNYRWAFKMNHRELFYELKNNSMLAVMCLLMNEYSRKYFLPTENIAEDSNVTSHSTKYYADKDQMYNEICGMIKTQNLSNELGDNLHSFAGVTDGYWKDIETKGKKYMIISMEPGNIVRSSGVHGEELHVSNIENRFVILDGIDYKSDFPTAQLVYMEV